jgi:hypothetical protein
MQKKIFSFKIQLYKTTMGMHGNFLSPFKSEIARL